MRGCLPATRQVALAFSACVGCCIIYVFRAKVSSFRSGHRCHFVLHSCQIIGNLVDPLVNLSKAHMTSLAMRGTRMIAVVVSYRIFTEIDR